MVKSIARYELKEKLEHDPSVQIVNALAPRYYHLGFIKGSKAIPLTELWRRREELDRSREVIVYGLGHGCPTSRNAAQMLQDLGFDVRAYEGGINEWKESGLPVEPPGAIAA